PLLDLPPAPPPPVGAADADGSAFDDPSTFVQFFKREDGQVRRSLPPRTAWRPNASLAAAHRAHVTWRPQRSGLIRSFVTPARGLAQM
ncbi:hypothetical protein, partial [Pseudomonas aeruginosa]|uniref:hypothetical protein n=1 Tax=Pseudomonas aeruginosa TaxID=287 RepID=UPI0019D3B159